MWRDKDSGLRWPLTSVGTLLAVVVLLLATRSIFAGGETLNPPVVTPEPAATAAATPVNDRSLEVQKVVDQRLAALYEEADATDPADRPAQQKLLSDYRQLQSLTGRSAFLPSGCEVAKQAARAQAFLWAKEAWEGCWEDGQVSGSNRTALDFYARNLRNLGRNLLEQQDEQARSKGLTYLVACVRVVARYQMNVGECRQDLVHWAGEDESRWPAAGLSPLLSVR